MAEATQYIFSHQEIVSLLVKQQGLHEGLWQLSLNVGFGAANLGPNPSELNPSVIVQIGGIGIQRTTERNGLTVDAAEVNPEP
jgi:hypothetical protein